MISVVAPAYNNANEVKKLLQSLANDCNEGKISEAIIVDDCSFDGSIAQVARRYPFARYIRLGQNGGAAKASNEGARNAKSDVILFLDSDVVINHDTIERVRRYFENEDAVALIGHLDTKPLNDGFFPRYKALMFNAWLPKGNYSTVFDSVMGAIRKDVFFECGGFDESIKGATVGYARLGFELRKKHKIFYDPELVVKVNLKGFKKALWTDFYSTVKWIEIFSEYGQLDNNCTTPDQAIGRLLGFLSIVSLPLVLIFSHRLFLLWLCLFISYLYANRAFFLLVLREEGLIFLLRSVPTHAILSVMTVLGGAVGVLSVIYKKIGGLWRRSERT